MSKVLVVVDMQNDFVTGSLKNEKADKIIEPIADYVKKCRNNNFIIMTTRDDHDMLYGKSREGHSIPGHWGEAY